ncbi:MAG: Opr family porin [Desulfurivibrio sp.]|nr:Opr family porin [Desulfurivibrio sp.]
MLTGVNFNYYLEELRYEEFTCGLAVAGLLSLAPLGAAAASLEEAFADGTLNGHVGAYGVSSKAKGSDREGFISGSASLAYETAPFHRLSFGFGAWGTTELTETNDGDYRAAIASDAIIHQAFARYTGDDWGQLQAGRYEIDLEWLNDYILGASARLTQLGGLDLTLGWAERQAVVDPDEVSERFEKMNDSKGLYFVDLQYAPVQWLTINPYYYHAGDMFQAPGLKLTADYELSDALAATSMAQYVSSNTDSAFGQEDGDYLWLEQGLAYGDFGFYAGYMQADNDGTGGIASFGDQMPFEEGNNIISADAKTWYLGLDYGWH